MFWLGRRPLVVADASGVVFRGKDPIPWSEIAEVEKPPDDGWKHHSTELVLRDGTRRTFGVDVEREDVELLWRLWAQAQRTGPKRRGPQSDSGPRLSRCEPCAILTL